MELLALTGKVDWKGLVPRTRVAAHWGRAGAGKGVNLERHKGMM